MVTFMTQVKTRSTWTLVLASIGAFMTALDTLVVASALPALRVDLGATVGELEWTVNAYNLTFAVFLLTGAVLGDRFGRKRTYIAGIALFTVSSVLAAVAPSIGLLIVARGLQGAAAAVLIPVSLTLITTAFPAEKRSLAIGVWGGISGLAVALGPVIGGAIVEGASWPWIFWLNVPIGALLIPAAFRFLLESHGPAQKVDVLGVVLAAVGFGILTWGLITATDAGWRSTQTTLTLAIGAVVIAGFVVWEARAAAPMVPVAIFANRGFAAANGVGFFMTAALFGALFLMMQFLQFGLGLSPLEAGLRTLPWTGAPMILAPTFGALAPRVGYRNLMAGGLALQGIGFAWLAAVATPGASYLAIAPALGVAGIGISMCLPTVPTVAVGSVAPSLMGVASGANAAVRQLGGVFGVAILAGVFNAASAFTDRDVFVTQFAHALWVAAALSVLGIAAAAMVPGSKARLEPQHQPQPQPLTHVNQGVVA